MKNFSYGEAFIKINSQLLKRYAACSSEEDIKRTEEEWLNKIEREYNESRAEREAGGADDMWHRGNTNRLEVPDSDDEDDNEDEEGAEEEEEEEEDKDPFAISDDSDDEEEMAEIRRKILNSKSFQNPTSASSPPSSQQQNQPQPISSTTAPSQPLNKKQLPIDSDSESGSAEVSDDGDDEAFDNIIDATPVTDRTGILAAKKQRKVNDSLTASFSRTVISAPKKW